MVHHKNRKKQDNNKNIFLKNKNIRVFRIRQAPLKSITSNDIVLKITKDVLLKADIDALLRKIKPYCDKDRVAAINSYLDATSFVNEKVFNHYMAKSFQNQILKSLEAKFPELVGEWDYEKISTEPSPLYPRER